MNLLFYVLVRQLDRPEGNASIQNYPGTPIDAVIDIAVFESLERFIMFALALVTRNQNDRSDKVGQV